MKLLRLHAPFHFMPVGRTLPKMNAKSENTRSGNPVPGSFPREPRGSAVSGMQPKALVRKVGDIYVAGQTEAERLERYEICLDLARQLLPYCRRKLLEQRDWSAEEVFRKTRVALRAKDWGLSNAEIDWIVQHVATTSGWADVQKLMTTNERGTDANS